MGRLPKEVLEKWTKLKHELLPSIDKIKDDTVSEATKKDLKKKVKTLYDQFDSGLSKLLKSANDAKTDKDALKPLSEASKTATAYLRKAQAAKSAWGELEGGAIAEKFEVRLEDIKRACEAETVRIAKSAK
jgi:hypothetical protein